MNNTNFERISILSNNERETLMSENTSLTAYEIPELHGAIGDGETDDTAAFNEMLATGNLILLTAGKTYFLGGELNTFENAHIEMNNATINTHTTIVLGDNSILTGGTIHENGREGATNPTVSIIGKNVVLDHVNFTSPGRNCYYIRVRQNADRTFIRHCHFDGKCKIGVLVAGKNCTIENCNFNALAYEGEKTNCIKLSADSSTDTYTPCSKNTYIKNCYFGYQSDNCVDCFSGANGLTIESCVFDNGDKTGIEIKNVFRDESDPEFSAGTSVPGIRINRDITVKGCEFLGTNNLFDVGTSAREGYMGTVEPVTNVRIIDCIAPNINQTPYGVSENVVNLLVDNLMLTGLTATVNIAARGVNHTIRNINNSNITIIAYGSINIENCKVKAINVANNNAEVDIYNCSSHNSGGSSFINFTKGKSVIVRDCYETNCNHLIGLNGAPIFMLAKNNIAKRLVNSGYSVSGGNVILANNLYTNVVMTDEIDTIINQNNVKITLTV